MSTEILVTCVQSLAIPIHNLFVSFIVGFGAGVSVQPSLDRSFMFAHAGIACVVRRVCSMESKAVIGVIPC